MTPPYKKQAKQSNNSQHRQASSSRGLPHQQLYLDNLFVSHPIQSNYQPSCPQFANLYYQGPQPAVNLYSNRSTRSGEVPTLTQHLSTSNQAGNANMNFFNSTLDFSEKKCKQFFKQYAAANNHEIIDPPGIERLCSDLQVSPDDIVVLIIAYFMDAKEMGIFTYKEWLKGMSDIKCDSLAKLKPKLQYLRAQFQDFTKFKSLYRYSFEFAKEGNQRVLDVDIAKQMLTILLQSRWPLLDDFMAFLDESKYRSINRDQYHNILDFYKSIECIDKDYDENGAWPVMMDEFVAWLRKKSEPPSDSKRKNSSDLEY